MRHSTRSSIAPFVALAILAAACGSNDNRPSPEPTTPAENVAGETAPRPPATETETETEGATDVPADNRPLETPEALATASNAFGFDVYQRVRAGDQNLAFSPLSIELAFSMVAAGARGDTEAELWRALHAGADHDGMHRAIAQLLASVGASRDTYELRIANRLFGQQGFAFEEPFLSLLRERYAAPLEPLQMTGDEDAARRQINEWVSEQTAQRIPELLPDGSVDAYTRLVLVNAIYFLAKWESPFEHDATYDAPFFAGGRTERRVPTMHQTGMFGYAAVDGMKALEMPYRGGDLSMIVLLPDARTGLGALEASLDTAKLARITSALSRAEVAVSLPKWEIRGARLPLVDVMKGLGVALAFDRAQADLTGIAPFATPEDRLYVSDAFHEAFVKVDEEGTEAAAATAVTVAVAGGMPAPPPNTFVADHPFVFLVRDVRSGAVLFLGRVVDPS